MTPARGRKRRDLPVFGHRPTKGLMVSDFPELLGTWDFTRNEGLDPGTTKASWKGGPRTDDGDGISQASQGRNSVLIWLASLPGIAVRIDLQELDSLDIGSYAFRHPVGTTQEPSYPTT